MTNKMGTTSEIVGPSERAQALPVVRPMSLNLENQLAREAEGRTDFTTKLTTSSRWLASKLRLGLLIVCVLASCAPLNAVEDAYTLESERSPKVDYYSQGKNRQAAEDFAGIRRCA